MDSSKIWVDCFFYSFQMRLTELQKFRYHGRACQLQLLTDHHMPMTPLGPKIMSRSTSQLELIPGGRPTT